ncbi:alpha/beta hydrolase [Solimonas sp. K1W22B-7]|uniref:alpha/beta hydrolase n=1 Tax=Solimonas sp. K1W22B-7 TaxID=2303331 RepID=UPI000E3342C1|nr:alpha/beta hydrolase [Solimonas sp. K1W22B-7]AXQ31312.1 alpha/beta hydrolase [Solimonas sp. K1W22B-7]
MSGNFTRSVLRLLVRLTLKPVLGPSVPVRMQRRLLKAAGIATRVPREVKVTPRMLGAAPGETLQLEGAAAQGAAILFLHGGGYCVGSLDSHRPLSATLAKASGLTVFALDYRLAPEHPYPAALNDAVAAYRTLLDEGHERIFLAGDSAGGGLALATALSLRDAGLPAPPALLLISPWTDLGCSGATMVSHAAHDPMLSQPGLQRWAAAYVGRVPTDHPLCSPLFADLRGLSPILIQSGSDEVLLDDTLRIEKALQQAKVPVTLQVYPGLWHDFHLQAGVMREADEAIGKLAAFAVEILTAAPAPRRRRAV